jgi:predicted homoserine dehydrogenase-like protein
VLFDDAAIAPMGAPFAEVLTAAKCDLKAGEVLDGIGGFHCYGLVDNVDVARAGNFVPMSLIEGCTLTRDIAKDEIISYQDLTFPKNRVCDRLRREQDSHFFNGTDV